MIAALPIRHKLALVFGTAMAIVLAGIGLFLYLRTKANLDTSINSALRSRSRDLSTLVRVEPSALAGSDQFFQVLDARGRILQGSPSARTTALLDPAELVRAQRSEVLAEHAERVRLLAHSVVTRGGTRIVVVASSLAQRENALETLAKALLIGGPLALLVAMGIGYGISTLALRPVEDMREQAARISSAHDSTRLELPGAPDEIARLGATLNEMLDRIEEAHAHERTFIANASHQLRTPLAILAAELEVTRTQAHGADELRAGIERAEDEARRLTRLTESLLTLARADHHTLLGRSVPIEAGELLGIVAARHYARVEGAGRRIDVEGPPDVVVTGDAERLQEAIGNLVDNAIRHGAGAILLTAHRKGADVVLGVRDHGQGLPAELLGVATDPFTKASSDGAGLGLAIAAAIAREHGGSLSIANPRDGGATAELRLPGASISLE